MPPSPNAGQGSHRLRKFSGWPRSEADVPSFQYRALTRSGELVSGSISAPTVSEVAKRIEYLGLLPVETIMEARDAAHADSGTSLFSRPRAEDVTVFTRDLALLLKAGAR